jgi:hypothetical protein
MKKFKYPLHYPVLIPNLKEDIDLALKKLPLKKT